MKYDVVIPLRSRSKWENREICFALRGIQKHLKNFGKVFVVTDRPPSWLCNAHVVECSDFQHRPQWSTTVKVNRAWEAGASENVILFNDDFFLTTAHDATKQPYYHMRQLGDADVARRDTPYVRAMSNTIRHLRKRGVANPLHFGVHCPIIYNRDVFQDTVMSANWDPREEFLTRLLYGNLAPGLKTERTDDRKLYHERKAAVLAAQVGDSRCFSIADEAIGAGMQEFLLSLYPKASRFEPAVST